MSSTGFRRSRFDGRAWQAEETEWPELGAIDIPFAPIDQGKAHCCIGAVISGAMEIIDNRDGSAVRLSPLFSYYTSRVRASSTRGTVAFDGGLAAAASKGICSFSLHEEHHGIELPYDEQAALIRPTRKAREDAERRRLLGYDVAQRKMAYYEISGRDIVREWIRAIEAGHPIGFGFVPSDVYRKLTPEDFLIEDVSLEQGNPGHAALAVGYSDGRFRIRDSRGTGFARNGYWDLAASVVQTRWIAESWVITRLADDS